MKLYLVIALSLCLSACASGLARAPSGAGRGADGATDPSADPAAGRALAAGSCGGCHAIGLRGASPLRAAPPFRDLHKRYDVEGLAESLAEGIDVGNPIMPEHVLDAGQIRDLIAYLHTLER